MNTFHPLRTPADLAGPPRACVALALALILLGPQETASAQGFGGGGGSDSVGSLPSTSSSGPGVGTASLRGGPSDQFQLALVGQGEQIEKLIIAKKKLDPQASFEIDPLDSRGTVKYSFSGAWEITLDRALLARGFVAVEVALGPTFAGGIARVRSGGRGALQRLWPGPFDLHLQQLSWSGLLDGGIELVAVTPRREVSRLSAGATANAILIRQHPTLP